MQELNKIKRMYLTYDEYSFKENSLWTLVNTNPNIPNYSHVFESAYGDYMITHTPEGIIGVCYYDIICFAESIRNHEKNNHVTVTDLVGIVNKFNKYTEDDKVSIKLNSKKHKPNTVDEASYVYKFPVDNVYMVVFEGKNNIYLIINEKENDK